MCRQFEPVFRQNNKMKTNDYLWKLFAGIKRPQIITSSQLLFKLDLNKFFQKISLKKQHIRLIKSIILLKKKKKKNKKHIRLLKNKITLLNNIKKNKHKILNSELFKVSNNFPIKNVSEISYILDFSFSKTNTTLHVMDCAGNSKYFYSAGLFDFKGNKKTSQSNNIFKKFYKILAFDLSFLKFSKIAIHFKNKNINYKISWFLKKLREKFFIAVVKFFMVYPYNGCRRKKPKRKKFKTKKKKKKKIWLSGLKR